MGKISLPDLHLLNFRVADLIQPKNGQDAKVFQQCKILVDRIVNKLKPHLKELWLEEENQLVPSLNPDGSQMKVFRIMTLSNGETLYLSDSGFFFQTQLYKNSDNLDFCSSYPWIFASSFGLFIMKLEELLDEGENRGSLTEKRLEILAKITEKYS